MIDVYKGDPVKECWTGRWQETARCPRADEELC